MNDINWKEVALYLADCHAANVDEAMLRSCSASRRMRFCSIMEKAEALLKGNASVPAPSSSSLENVIQRLEEGQSKIKALRTAAPSPSLLSRVLDSQ